MRLGFSYIGLIYLIMLFVPNIIWAKNQPENYGKYVGNEEQAASYTREDWRSACEWNRACIFRFQFRGKKKNVFIRILRGIAAALLVALFGVISAIIAVCNVNYVKHYPNILSNENNCRIY